MSRHPIPRIMNIIEIKEGNVMKTVGNIIWFIFGGFISFISWGFVGLLWSITIVGLPIGRQCFKIAKLGAAPFGKEIHFADDNTSLLFNILWIIFGGFALVLEEAAMGLFFCITIVGIPFGIQHLKQARLALSPFGTKIYNV